MMRLPSALLLLVLPGLAAAEPITVRAGSAPGYGRLVFDWPASPAYSLEQQGDRVLLHFPAGTEWRLPQRPPANVVALAAEGEALRLSLRPGTRARHYRLGSRVVVELLDPTPEMVADPPGRQPAERGPGTAGGASPAAAPAAPPVVPPAAVPAPVSPAAPQEAAGPVSVPAGRPVEIPSAAPAPIRLTASRLSLPAGPAILLPFPAGTGAAILPRGEVLLLVFDSPEGPDLAPLQDDPVFGGLRAEALPEATLMRLPLAATARLLARREATGWTLAVAPAGEAPLPEIDLATESGPPARLLLRAPSPGRVVPVQDPETGLPLLVGTLRQGQAAMRTGRRLPELDLPPTLLGTAVLARSDGVLLQAGTDRFTLALAGGGRLSLDTALAGPVPAPELVRSFDLPARPPAELMTQLQALQAGIAAAPPLARLPQRRAAGELLLALGLPQEAQAMLSLGFAEDPRAAADPSYAALAGAAALLAGRLAEAEALRSPAWGGGDEARLWQATLAAARSEWQPAAAGFARSLPLLLAYPAGLKARLLPLAAQALAEAGETAALRRLLDTAGTGAAELALPRAMLAEAEGRSEEALAAYDRLAAGRDRRVRARALRQAVELRLASGRIDAASAAKAIEAGLLAWRGDATEMDARLRAAALYREAGKGRAALDLLRDTAALFPDRGKALRPALQESFVAALAEAPPLAAVALYDAHPDLRPEGAGSEQAILLLADRLTALDLGDRAAGLLRQVMQQAEGTSRAALGLRLARLRFEEGDFAGAAAALADSAVPELPPAQQVARAVLAARIEARRGQRDDAVAALRSLGAPGSEALAEVLVEASDWSGAAAAHATALAALPPAPAVLTDAEARLVLRQAVLLALAGDEAGLVTLREAQAGRVGAGPLADAFALLTGDPLRGLADLPRLQRELQLFRSLPSRLEALRAGPPLTR